MYFSTFLWFALPIGRGPKATISFTYCMARLALNAGGASGGASALGGESPFARRAASTGALRAHAKSPSSTEVNKTTLALVFIRTLPSCDFVSFVFKIWRLYFALRASRAFLCVGCTNHAIPMLKIYKASMGAAKIHMLVMSGVGVSIPAIMKIARIA